VTNLLMLANNPGEITQRGMEHKRDLVIDLAWYNEVAVQRGTFLGLTIDWEGSLGLDHALVNISNRPNEPGVAYIAKDDLGQVMDPEREEDLIHIFKTLPAAHPLLKAPIVEEVKTATAALTTAIQLTNKIVLYKQHPFHDKVSPWWSANCMTAVHNL